MADIKALINAAGFSLKAGRVTMKPVTQADAGAYCKAFDVDVNKAFVVSSNESRIDFSVLTS